MKQRRNKRHSGGGTAVPAFAKITRPVLTGVYDRSRLFKRLDQARKRPIVWISAPAGSGKTTLVASYLQARKLPALWYQLDTGDGDPASFFYYMGLAAAATDPRSRSRLPLLTREYIAGLSTFAANYFRQLFNRIKHPSVVVLDDYHDVDPNGEIQGALSAGLEQIPDRTNVVVLSRQGPPSAFARLRASDRISLLDWEELRLTEEESAAIAKLRSKEGGRADLAEQLHRHTQGWVAGLVLLTEHPASATQAQPQSDDIASQAIFDYFASEVFRRTDPLMRQFLLKTSFVPKISLQVARGVAEETNSEAILRDLTQRNYFTIKHADGTYEYHPLFRAFLANRARAIFTGEQIKLLMERSAELLADNGDVETAITLLQQAEDWRGAARLVLKHAQALFLQGRTHTLDRWLRALPVSLRSENPWALYWLGVCCLSSTPAEARGYLEQAFTLFERQTDASALYLVWSRIIESFLFEVNFRPPMMQWVERYATLKNDRVPPSPSIEKASVFTLVSGLTNARCDHPDLLAYVERAEELLQRETDEERRLTRVAALIPYHLWKGNFVRVGQLLEGLRHASGPISIGRLNWYVWKTLYDGRTGNAKDALRAMNEGLALAEASGVHVLDLQLLVHGLWGQLCARDIAAARAIFQRMSTVKRGGEGDDAFYLHHSSLLALHEGNIARALEESRRAVASAKASQMFIGVLSYLAGLAYIRFRHGDIEGALQCIEEGREKDRAMGGSSFGIQYDFCEAAIRLSRGERDACLTTLQRAVTNAIAMGCVTPVTCLDDDAAKLYTLALEVGLAPDFVGAEILRLRLSPPVSLPENWPWQLRIRALGGFAVTKDDELVTFSGRSDKKPRELLRALVTFGGEDVDVSRLIEALWPDADGDKAKLSFKTALYRLRKILGDRCLLLQNGQLSLNRQLCWVDVWAFERLLEEGNGATRVSSSKERLLQLYRGPFLGDHDSSFALVPRERLRAKFLRTVMQGGQELEAGPNHDDTVAWYQKAIDVEPFAEELYRRLLNLYRHLNRKAEAIALYRRYVSTFTTVLGIEPSNDIVALHAAIKAGNT